LLDDNPTPTDCSYGIGLRMQRGHVHLN
jgi:hypothetical protein